MSFGFSSWDILRGSFFFSAFLWFLFDPKLAFLFLSVQAISLTINTRQTSDARKTMANIKNLEPSFLRHFWNLCTCEHFLFKPQDHIQSVHFFFIKADGFFILLSVSELVFSPASPFDAFFST